MNRKHLLRILIALSLLAVIKLHATEVDDPVAPASTEVVAKALPATPVAAATAAEEPADKNSPVVVPGLAHYAKLWTDSLFTTRALPPPEATGPNFTDNLSLSGTYEENGKLTAILIDKATSNVVMAYIGEDNPEGFRIVKVNPGASADQTRLQLQKGSQFGWVSYGADMTGDGAGVSGLAPPPPASVLGTRGGMPPGNHPGNTMMRPGGANALNGYGGSPNNGGAMNGGGPVPQMPSPLIPAAIPVAEPAQPPSLRGGMPQAAPAVPMDIPLPPP